LWSKRYHAVMEVVSGGIPVVEVAERYGVSRKTVHTWPGRYRFPSQQQQTATEKLLPQLPATSSPLTHRRRAPCPA
jgi:transposase